MISSLVTSLIQSHESFVHSSSWLSVSEQADIRILARVILEAVHLISLWNAILKNGWKCHTGQFNCLGWWRFSCL